MNQPDQLKKRPVVAVVAVHGVADQVQNATVRKISDLLAAGRFADTRAWYTTAHEIPLRISTRAVQLGHGGDPEKKRSFHDMSLDSHRASRGTALAAGGTSEPIDFAFARKVLEPDPDEGLPPPDPADVYETIRIEMSKLKNAEPAVDVHLYEMYWTDLSRHGMGVLKIFGELYQILCHLGTLGRSTVDAAAMEHAGSLRWNWYARLQSWATDAMVIWIAVLNIVIVGLAVIVTLTALYSQIELGRAIHWILPWALLGMLLVVGAACGFVSWRSPPGLLWTLSPLLIGLSIGVGGLLNQNDPGAAPRLADLIAMGAGVLLSTVIVRAYQKRRPGAGKAAIACGTIVGSRVVYAWLSDISTNNLAGLSAGMSGLEILLNYMLPGCWIAFLSLLSLASIAGLWAIRDVKPGADRSGPALQMLRRARRVAFTARLVLSLSAAFFTVITMALWSAFWKALAGSTWFISSAPYKTLGGGEQTVGDYIGSFFQTTRALEFELFVGLIAISAIICAWAIGPSAFEEIMPPDRPRAGLAGHIGTWLDRGYKFMRCAGELLFLGVAGSLIFYILWPFHFHWLAVLNNGSVLRYAGAFVAASAVGLATFRGRLDALALGFRPIVDVLLDIDNHLREFPHGTNPRAMIAGRCVSLLRYLAQWRDENNTRGYDGIVIIAHSQGTVITADLLRFLNHEWPGIQHKDPELAPILDRRLPLYLFTMGSPLRQLYSLRFPDLYRWARNTDESNWPNHTTLIPDDQLPDPEALGLKSWVNAFRSGDYIGRYLWRPDVCDFQWSSAVSEDRAGKRREFCIGPGAHTHYWDKTAPEIAAELDRLICIAAVS